MDTVPGHASPRLRDTSAGSPRSGASIILYALPVIGGPM